MAAEQNIVGEVYLLVKPLDPNAQFDAGVKKIIANIEKNAQFQVKAAGLEDIQQQANGIGNAFAEASIQAAGLTAAVFGIRAAVEGTIGKFSGLFDQLAQAKAGFSSILKSEALGNNLLNDIREFARVSPFVTQELVNYSQQLLGVGENAKEIIPLLKSTGDILSSVGGDTTQLGRVLFTLTQIKSIGSLKGQDTLQLQNSLIPITKYLSAYLGKTSAEIVKLRENGQITAEQVFAAINAQGEKVKGAMDKATRNIVGARAILSDTITILLQNQPVLNKIFENIYKGILTLSNFLSTPEFTDSFNQFFEGVDKVYEALKPLFGSLGDLGQSATIQSLQVFGTVLGTIGDVLNALPSGVLEILGRVLAAMAVLKAPLMLIRYAQSLQTIVHGIVPAVSGLAKLGNATEMSAVASKAAAAAYEAEAAALRGVAVAAEAAAVAEVSTSAGGAAGGGFFRRNSGRIGQGALIGAAVLGGELSQSKNDTAKLAGGALTYGAIGGAVGGPLGAAIGVEFGLLTGYFNKRKEDARKWAKELKDIGEQGAADFVTAVGKQFGSATSGGAYQAIQDQISSLQKSIGREQDKIAAKVQRTTVQSHGRGGVGNANIGLEKDAITLLQTQLDALQKDATTTFTPVQQGIASLVEGLTVGEAGYTAFTNAISTKGHIGVRQATIDIAQAEAAAKKYGFSLDDLADPEKLDGIVKLIQAFDGISTAQQNATAAAEKYNKTLDDSKKLAAAIFDPGQKQLQSRIDSIKATSEAEAAQYDFSTKNSDLNAKLVAQKQEEAKWAERYAYYIGLGYANTTALYRANIEGEEEYQRLLALRNGARNNQAIADRRTNANLNDPATRDIHSQGRDINGEIAAAEKAAKDAADKAQKDAEDAAKKAQEWADTLKNATESLADKLTSAADEIAAAAERWVGSIKERTQYEQAISVGTLTRNAQRQVNDITELSAGITQLRAKGLSDAAMKALGIDNVADLKQVRKLLRGSPGDLTKLSSTVSDLNSKATDLATREEDTRTRANITAGILDAAKTLGIDLTKEQAASIGGNFTITTISNADEVAQAIISALASGKISR